MTRTTASTYINGDVVVCILEHILSASEQALVAAGSVGEVLDGRVAFQAEREDAFSRAVERLTLRRVVAFLSGNQTSPGIACEMFFLRSRRSGRPGDARVVAALDGCRADARGPGG